MKKRTVKKKYKYRLSANTWECRKEYLENFPKKGHKHFQQVQYQGKFGKLGKFYNKQRPRSLDKKISNSKIWLEAIFFIQVGPNEGWEARKPMESTHCLILVRISIKENLEMFKLSRGKFGSHVKIFHPRTKHSPFTQWQPLGACGSSLQTCPSPQSPGRVQPPVGGQSSPVNELMRLDSEKTCNFTEHQLAVVFYDVCEGTFQEICIQKSSGRIVRIQVNMIDIARFKEL